MNRYTECNMIFCLFKTVYTTLTKCCFKPQVQISQCYRDLASSTSYFWPRTERVGTEGKYIYNPSLNRKSLSSGWNVFIMTVKWHALNSLWYFFLQISVFKNTYTHIFLTIFFLMMYSIKKTANEIIQNIIIKTLNVLYVGCFCVIVCHLIVYCTVCAHNEQ